MNNVGDALCVKQVQHAGVGADRSRPAAREVPHHFQDPGVRARCVGKDRGVFLDLPQIPERYGTKPDLTSRMTLSTSIMSANRPAAKPGGLR